MPGKRSKLDIKSQQLEETEETDLIVNGSETGEDEAHHSSVSNTGSHESEEKLSKKARKKQKRKEKEKEMKKSSPSKSVSHGKGKKGVNSSNTKDVFGEKFFDAIDDQYNANNSGLGFCSKCIIVILIVGLGVGLGFYARYYSDSVEEESYAERFKDSSEKWEGFSNEDVVNEDESLFMDTRTSDNWAYDSVTEDSRQQTSTEDILTESAKEYVTEEYTAQSERLESEASDHSNVIITTKVEGDDWQEELWPSESEEPKYSEYSASPSEEPGYFAETVDFGMSEPITEESKEEPTTEASIVESSHPHQEDNQNYNTVNVQEPLSEEALQSYPSERGDINAEEESQPESILSPSEPNDYWSTANEQATYDELYSQYEYYTEPNRGKYQAVEEEAPNSCASDGIGCKEETEGEQNNWIPEERPEDVLIKDDEEIYFW